MTIPVYNATDVWNDSGTVFTAIKMNVTNTASAAGSKLIDLQVGGATHFSITPITATGANLRVGNGHGFADAGSNAVQIVVGGGSVWQFDNSGNFFASVSGGAIGFSPSTLLFADATNILAQRNGTSANTFRVYNTFNDSSNYERGIFDWTSTSNMLTIGTEKAGTGSSRDLTLQSASANINLQTGPSTNFMAQAFRVNDINTLVLLGSVIIRNGGADSNTLQMPSGTGIAFPSGAADLNLSRSAAKVLRIGDGSTTFNSNGWIQWGGQARVTSDFSVTSSTVLTNVTGLSVSVQAGRTYAFESELYVTDAAAGGVQAAIAGTATATAIQYTGYTIADNAIKGKTNATALATAVGSTVTTETSGIVVRITGTITVNAAGTLTVQMAQNTSNGTATVAKRGSYFIVQDMP
jgi:hypothetical protein